ncbi:MAG TPA: hypothetical protein VIF57_32365 [Polyangia bacterium]|jgi:hypothetical protein
MTADWCGRRWKKATSPFTRRRSGGCGDALEEAGAASTLAEEPTARPALHDLLVRIRLGRP